MNFRSEGFLRESRRDFSSVIEKWSAAIDMGLNPDLLELEPLVQKDGKTTSGFDFSHSHGRTSGIVLMMGSNSFPGDDGLEKIVEIMKSQQ